MLDDRGGGGMTVEGAVLFQPRGKFMPLNASEAAIEAELKTKGLNAPRLTPADIDAVIVGEDYHVFPGTTMTVCALKLRNGFVVVGESAAASPENFDEAIGRRIARENARNRIWALEDYVLRERLSGRRASRRAG